ncbi:hypothetical protein EDD16DRAFT_1522009 [Pisolithus croceorrhizus]|nr:hypothetical protein EDD16DRAFT_1522009 [Pisolithus croceorrhizus]
MQKECTPPPKRIPAPDAIPRPKETVAGVLLWDFGEVLSVSLGYFKSAALPPLRQQINVNQIKESLQRDATVWSRDSRRWAKFKTDPKKSGQSEDETFEPLSEVFDAVVGEASKTAGTPAKLRFASRPSEAPISERTNSTRPDAYLLLVDKKNVDIPEGKMAHTSKKSPDSWDDIVVSFEFKKGNTDTDRKDDDQKVVWSLHHIMRGDPCRRATFGVTIENTEMRFWFTCRAVTLVSQSFNFCTEPEHLIYFFCSLAFAEDHELGWDPTIQRVGVGGKIQYNITVRTDEGKDLVYQTTRVISDYSADASSGRGTRVFEARLIFLNGTSVKDAEPVVLKDSWGDGDRDREDIILNQIFADLQKHKGREQEEEARKYFLTVLAAGNVMVEGNIDNTDRLLRESDLPPDRSYRLPVDEVPKQKPIRTHSRLVFREVCQPLYELQTLDTVFATLEDARKALQFLHSVGWVHRDVSGGNVLRWDNLGKLADLEYAKHMNSNASHEVRTGTLDFMACEVEAQKHLFIQPKAIRKDPASRKRVQFPFRFNPLHDVESIWWIATWILYYHVDEKGRQLSTDQIRCFRELFPGRLNSRTSAFLAPLADAVLPTPFQTAAHIVEDMRDQLRIAYTASETNMPPVYDDALEMLHSTFNECFASAAEHSRGVGLFRPPAAHRQQHSSAKRQQEDPVADPRDPKQLKIACFYFGVLLFKWTEKANSSVH